MTDDLKNHVPESVRKVIEGMVGQAIARCEREGIALEDFYRAISAEHELDPKSSVVELFERTFRRLRLEAN